MPDKETYRRKIYETVHVETAYYFTSLCISLQQMGDRVFWSQRQVQVSYLDLDSGAFSGNGKKTFKMYLNI